MQQDSKHTKSKVMAGYMLLAMLSILTAFFLYRQITRIAVDDGFAGRTNRKLFIVSNTVNGLYKAEALSNAFIQTNSKRSLQAYMELMEETSGHIDSLRQLTTRSGQRRRLDTILLLLKAKVRNLKDLAYVKNSFIPEEFYDRAIAHIESMDGPDEGIQVVRRYYTTVDSSYVKTVRKKRGWFSRTREDSVLRVSTRQHVILDTLENDLQKTDTVVEILRSAWEDAQKKNEDQRQKILRKERALVLQSADITEQLKNIIGTYEQDEIAHIYRKQTEREETVKAVVHVLALVAMTAFLLFVLFTFFIFRDIGRSQRYRRELESANGYAARLLKDRERMLLTVTHDIKSPLSSVMGYIELLEHTGLNSRQRYFLKNMQGSSEHISSLVSNLLDLSRLENSRIQPEEHVFNPSSLFLEVVGTFLPMAREKGLELSYSCSPDLDAGFSGDVLRIRQIITNILSNAVKYTFSGGVSFRAEWQDGLAVLEVEDTGSGMTEEEQKLVFEEFTRLRSHAGIEGTGLGLTITLKLIHLLGGELGLESTPGKGSLFTVRLPLVRTEVAADRTEEREVRDLSFLKVMVVDDDPLQLEMTRAMLERSGIRPFVTDSPAEVLEKLEKDAYDLVFTDIQMPGMDGFGLVGKIRSMDRPYAGTLPVVALSADSGKEAEEYLSAGFTAYLGKPFTCSGLMDTVASLTGFRTCTGERTEEGPEPAQGYTLKHITEFTDNDGEALRKIVDSFVSETEEHLSRLSRLADEGEVEGISRLSHKMLPMFRQLEAAAVIPGLEKLENPERHGLSQAEVLDLCRKAIERISELLPLIRSNRASSGCTGSSGLS